MDKKKVSEHWGNFHTKKRKKLSWAESETVKLYINKRISGNEHKNSYRMVIDEYGQFDRALIVGCGSGALERDLFRLGFFNEAVGVDIAEESLKLARKKSKEDGIDKIKYINLDLESKDLKKLGLFIKIIKIKKKKKKKFDFIRKKEKALILRKNFEKNITKNS